MIPPVAASLVIHFGGGQTKFDVSFGIGKQQPETPADILIHAAAGAGAEAFMRVTEPEQDDLRQKLYDEWWRHA